MPRQREANADARLSEERVVRVQMDYMSSIAEEKKYAKKMGLSGSSLRTPDRQG